MLMYLFQPFSLLDALLLWFVMDTDALISILRNLNTQRFLTNLAKVILSHHSLSVPVINKATMSIK
jgi:hypothetical protein